MIRGRCGYCAGLRAVRSVGLTGALMALAGCATVVRGTHETFHIISSPVGAVAQLSSGESCVTPCAVELPRANAFQVRVAKPGFVTQTVEVRTVGSGAGGIALLSNAVVGGIVGASVDLSSGAMRNLSPNPLKVELTSTPVDPPAVPPVTTPVASDPARSVTATNAAPAVPATP